ncbi:MAG: CoA activase [Chloroflexi bacterium]|nr:CoA activase [Chloroflexota bacterium]
MDPESDEILWKDYERHETKQPEKVLSFLSRIGEEFDLSNESTKIFITGSGGTVLTPTLGAKFVQEVNAVSLAVEHLYPDAGSVIELGGQDAKIIIWFTDEKTGVKRKIPSMNDKCAGGTGAVIDKISSKLQLSSETLVKLPYWGVELHPVAGKCGVFAETDINGLQKEGVPSDQLMASLYEAIVQQNLSVLTRGNTLRPQVLLLGGPNCYIPALRDCWKENIPKIWEERNYPLPEGVDPKDLIIVPDNAQYFAAIGAVLYGKSEDADIGIFRGTAKLEEFVEYGRTKMREASGDVGLAKDAQELEEFKKLFAKEPFNPPKFNKGDVVEVFIGIDGGSTSTKGVLMDAKGELLATAYQLSKGNPIADTQDILADLRGQIESQGATLEVKGIATTGYAKDMLKESLNADVGIVETVAHTKSALHYYKDADVIVDVGGQDIKVIVLKEGKVKDFKLNTQCSAGNGYFLQGTAAKFGYSVSEFADAAFSAERLPVFGYGCAVFMETDIVNFQQLGWQKHEIMAGLAKVLPKNIWLYVVAEPNLAKFGTNFILQGGTQHNLAAVKAQYDFIKSKVPNCTIRVHKFTGESGAIGAALEAIRVAAERDSTFIGIEAAENLEFTTTRDESTRCGRCKNDCLRTYIDTKTPDGKTRRYIIATCEKGEVETMDDLKDQQKELAAIKKKNPNFVERGSVDPFRSFQPEKVSTLREDPSEQSSNGKGGFKFGFGRKNKKTEQVVPVSDEVRELRKNIKIGMPRTLNFYTLAPLFRSYFESLGVSIRNIIYSDHTNPEMWYKGSRRGSIDQCFPSKSALAHIHNLVFDQKHKPDIIFFPVLHTLETELSNVVDSAACPTVAITAEVVKAAFTKEGDVFAEHNITYVSPSLDMQDWDMFVVQMYHAFKDILKITPEESKEALDIAGKALAGYRVKVRSQSREVLEMLEKEGRVGVVMLGRPYHNDPGLNHGIMDEIQKRGYPIFSVASLPQDPDILERLFGEEVRTGAITDPMDITDVWKNCYSENSSMKVWGAKFTARHPNLVAIDLSSFKCGHDAPMYDVIERIIEYTGTPYFTFHDIDESKPSGSIKIRVETIDYFLQRYQEFLKKKLGAADEVRMLVENYKAQMVRANERAKAKVAAQAEEQDPFAGGMISISGNNNNAMVRNGHSLNDHDAESMQNGRNGHRKISDAAVTDLLATDNGHIDGHSRALELDAAAAETYNQVRSRNTKNDPAPEDVAPSFSAMCGVPTKDFSAAAYAKDKDSKPVEIPAQLIEVDSFKAMIKAKQAKRKTEQESDKIPVAGD